MFLIGLPIGLLILGLFYWKDRDAIRVEWPAVASFIAFMVIVTFIRLSFFDLFSWINPSLIPNIHSELLTMPRILFSFVFWEDCVFVLPIYLAFKYLRTKWAIAVTLILSGVFGFGHLYQGEMAVLITSIYPYIAYRYGLKYGFGTIMLCHVLYDYFTFYTLMLAQAGIW